MHQSVFMRSCLFFLGIVLLLQGCGSASDQEVAQESATFQESMLTRAWVLETAYSNIDSVMQQVKPQGSKLFLESDYSYMILAPDGQRFDGIWKVDSTGRYLFMAPAGSSMKKWFIKALESEQLITYLPLDSAEVGWIEETYRIAR